MKKFILSSLIFLLLLYPALLHASYLIHFNGGGKLVTPRYWEEKGRVCFYYEGGIAGVERGDVNRIERYDEMRNESGISNSSEESKPLFVSPGTQDVQQTEMAPETAAKEETTSIEDYKIEKDRLSDELNQLLEQLREATAQKDKEAKDKIREKLRSVSGQIYDITDKVKEKNKGRLPEGWWQK